MRLLIEQLLIAIELLLKVSNRIGPILLIDLVLEKNSNQLSIFLNFKWLK